MHEIPLNEHCNPNQTIETAHAILFRLAPPDPWRGVTVWREGQRWLRPVTKPRIRDLRPGDEVLFRGQQETIYAVEVYR